MSHATQELSEMIARNKEACIFLYLSWVKCEQSWEIQLEDKRVWSNNKLVRT